MSKYPYNNRTCVREIFEERNHGLSEGTRFLQGPVRSPAACVALLPAMAGHDLGSEED